MPAPITTRDERFCAVTGANGYVGSRIADAMRRRGWRVREMRHDQTGRDPDHPDRIPLSLEEAVSSSELAGIDVLIHCAYDFRAIRWHDIERINVDGSTRLFEAAGAAGVPRIVYCSSMSAFEGCKSLYGKAKLRIEERAAGFGAVSVRPGLVYGERSGGTFGGLVKVASVSPVIPLVDDGSYRQYLAHEDDLCRLVGELCDRAEVSDLPPVLAAAEASRSLREIFEILAARRGRKVLFVPIPSGLILALLRVTESVGLKTGFRSDSLISLVNQDPTPDFGPTRTLSTTFRPFGPELAG